MAEWCDYCAAVRATEDGLETHLEIKHPEKVTNGND